MQQSVLGCLWNASEIDPLLTTLTVGRALTTLPLLLLILCARALTRTAGSALSTKPSPRFSTSPAETLQSAAWLQGLESRSWIFRGQLRKSPIRRYHCAAVSL